MFYVKMIVQAPDDAALSETLLAIMNKRWEFIPLTTSGGNKAQRFTAADDWVFSPNIDSYNSAEAKARFQGIDKVFDSGTGYYEAIKVWDSANIAQNFVAAIQSLNLTGVTISYEGEIDPTAV
jgi:hypothetical protein